MRVLLQNSPIYKDHYLDQGLAEDQSPEVPDHATALCIRHKTRYNYIEYEVYVRRPGRADCGAVRFEYAYTCNRGEGCSCKDQGE